MAADDPHEAETTVGDGGTVVIPPSLKRRLDIEPGDTLRWCLTGDGTAEVSVVDRTEGAFDDFEPVSMGGGGDAHDRVGHEADRGGDGR